MQSWPIFRSLKGSTPASLGHDLVAGLTLAAIAIPTQMATARLGGFAPQLGFFAFAAATLGFAAFGGSRQLVAGADSTITPIFAGSLAAMAVAGSVQYGELATVLALMVGAMLVAAGAFRLGWVADLLSRPVITGFLAGIALHIALSQAPAVLGVASSSGGVFRQLAGLASKAGEFNPISTAIGLGVVAIAVVAHQISARVPGALIALVGAAAATAAFGLGGRGVAVLGLASGGFPHPGIPRMGFETLLPMVGLAFLISLVVMVQTAATTRSFLGPDGEPDVNRDYVGIGVGGVLAGLVGVFPVNASPPVTSVVVEAGGRSQAANLVAVVLVLLLAAFGGRLLADIPTAALGGVLLYVAVRIFDIRTFAAILRRTRGEFALAAGTTALIFVLPIQTGVALGMFLSLVHGVFTITRVRPIPFERVPGTTVWWPASPATKGETAPGCLVMGFQAPLSFLNAYDFRRGVLEAVERCQGEVSLFVLEASSIVEIDFTASAILIEVIGKVREAGMVFAIARLESLRAQIAFDRLGVTDCLGRDRVFQTVEAAVRALADTAHASPTLDGQS